MISLNFRTKLFVAMILLVVGVTATTLLITENQVRASYERHFRQSFQAQMASFLQQRASRLAPVKERIVAAAASPRLLAAMENAGQPTFEAQDIDDLYQNGIDQLAEVVSLAGFTRTNRQTGFFFFLNVKGEVLWPSKQVKLPMALPELGQLAQPLSTISLSLSRDGALEVGYLSFKGKSKRLPIYEMVFTPVVDRANQQKLGVLAVGFPLPTAVESSSETDGKPASAELAAQPPGSSEAVGGLANVPSGIWVDGQLYTTAIAPEILSEIEQAIGMEITANNSPGKDLLVRSEGIPYQVHYEALNTGAGFPTAYQVCLFSLTEAEAEKRQLRDKILLSGFGAVLAALALSLLVSRNLAVPIRELVKGTTEIERGNYHVRVPVWSRDEVGHLAQAFNRMTQQIEASHAAQEQRITERNQELAERKRAQEALSQSEARLREAQRIAHLGNWNLNLVSQEMHWSEEVYHILGLTPHTFPPTFERYLERVHPEDRDKVAAAVRTALNLHKAYGLEHRVMRPDGSFRVVTERGIVSQDEAGQATGVVGTIQDITEQKQIEAEILRAQRFDSMGALASSLAHDLNKALSPVLMGIQLIKRKTNDSETREMLKVMETNTYRGADMVRQVLTFAGGSDAEREVLNVGRLIREMESIVRQALPNSIQTSAMVPPDLWPVIGNSTQIHQVLLNLCINARDAMESGGEISLLADNVDLTEDEANEISGASPGQYVMLLVSDNGTGIPPEILPRIFEPFFTTKGPDKGTGLGLSTIARIVRNHGGFLSVKSEVGVGTTFEIFLPRAPADLVVEGPVGSLPLGNPGRGEMILLLDADQSVRELVTSSLAEHGYRVLSAANRSEGIALLKANRQNLALLLVDAMTLNPSEDSLLISSGKPLPLVIMSGPTELPSIPGVAHLLRKPFSLEQLLSSVQHSLNSAQMPGSAS